MVLKGQLCDWFSKLGPFKRIEYMCALLHLCLPLELRFLGSVLEDLCKKDFIFLREAESQANNVSMLGKFNVQLPNILISLTLLNSSNTKCANILYKLLQDYLQSCFNKILSKELLDEQQKNAFTDLVTVLTIAVNHPAFSFEQKQSLSEFYLRALEYSHKLEQEELDLELCSPHSSGSSHPPIHQHEVCIVGIELKDVKRNSDHLDLNIQVKLSNGVILDIWKTSQEIYDFSNRLSSMFHNHNTIPVLQSSNIIKDDRGLFANYIRKICQLPKNILDNEYVCEFFGCHQMNKMLSQVNLSPKSTYCPSSSPSNLSADEEQIGMPIPQFEIKSLTFQNAQFPVCQNIERFNDQIPPPATVIPNRLNGSGVLSAQNDSPSHSPLSSCTNSTQNSPSSSPLSQTPDMISVTQLLKLLKMEEYSDQLSKYTVQELRSLIDEDLVFKDLPKQAHIKLRKKLNDYFREKPNGIIEPHIMVPNVSPMVQTIPWATCIPPPGYCYPTNQPLPSTRDSSPSNSEPSSPPASPHLPSSNNIKSSNSSGSEDKNQRDEKESTPTGSLPRPGKGHGGKFIPQYRDMLPPPPGSYPDPSLDPTVIQNGFPDNPHHMTSAMRPDMLNNIHGRPFPHGKPLQYHQPKHVFMHDKAGYPCFIQHHTVRNEYSIPTSMMPGESQNRQYMTQPGILGQPPIRPANTATMTNAVGPHTSLTPTPPMTVNTGTKSPNNVPTIVNSSSESNLQNPEQSNSPSPLPVNNTPAAIPTVPCTSGGPVIHNHQPCSTCGSRPQPFPFTAGYFPTSNGFMPIPSMPHPYQHMHPHLPILTPDMLNTMPPTMIHNYPVQQFLNYPNYMYSSVNNSQTNKKTNCYNCGSKQHNSSECKEATMESTAGNYHLNYKKSDSD
ncbi:hypothetical protein LOTGIDRAFT_159650 [Lottia gigantea]|uniref:CCHC-type domain-containing protein n=1 Tax=Lottia gigantea TaxID=225164 RepID=V4AQ39_LOTGI|nr:hypothetical protein LOTGIDRAFT_159650 [Lottia gigantea]ESO96900.1 hypothetical protein LOTGIDRAFT_159650 [Lottia gigantea]